MPPKKQQGQGPSKKTVEKKKDKIIEDKTFGLKNKKGKKQQTFIKQVTNQVKYGGGQSIAKREGDVYQQRKEKAQSEKEQAEMHGLFRPVQQTQKVSAGADPKSVLCLFFKQGACTKGDKCKFSHDLSLENKSEKRSMYVDSRDADGLEEDTIDKWDTDKLSEVVKKKHSAKMKTKTDIVCKHFLQAIEKGIYGWFWECPNGGDKCIYRHALPPGFVLKKMQKEQEELQPQDTITLEELVEKEREALISSGKTLTKVTLESFLSWKKRKLREKSEKAENEMEKRKEAFKQGKTLGISGREMFLFNPDLVGGDSEEDEEEGSVFHMVRPELEEDEEEGVDMAAMLANIGDGDEVTMVKSEGEPSSSAKLQVSDSEDDDRGGAVGGAVGGSSGKTNGDVSTEVVVDEQLFEGGFDDISGGQTIVEEEVGEAGLVKSGDMNNVQEDHVDVDESLFDVDDLGTLNLDDPANLTLPSDDTTS